MFCVIWYYFYNVKKCKKYPWGVNQGRTQNLKEVLQNFTKVFNFDDVTSSNVIQRNQHHKQKNKLECSIVITDVKLASYLKRDSEFCFSFLWQEHYHSKIPSTWSSMYLSITVLFWLKVHSAISANIYLFKVWIATLK